LRVLNLAGNAISHVQNLMGLGALTELNLRRNSIETVQDLNSLPSLQRVFLSNNQIISFDHCACLFAVTHLMELALDGNPIAESTHYRQYVLDHIKTLRHLDLKRITDEERRISSILSKQEEVKQEVQSKQQKSESQKKESIAAVQKEWESWKQCNSGWMDTEDGCLSLYGKCRDIDWRSDSILHMTGFSASYIHINNLADYWYRLKKCPLLRRVELSNNELDRLNQLHWLSYLAQVTHLSIENNGVGSSSLLRVYCLNMLEGLEVINGIAVTHEERMQARTYLSPFRDLCLSLGVHPIPYVSPFDVCVPLGESSMAGPMGLEEHRIRTNALSVHATNMTSVNKLIDTMIEGACENARKIEALNEAWPELVTSMIAKYLVQQSEG